MEITKQEAIERLTDYCPILSLESAAAVLDFLTMEDGVNGIGLLPPLTKKGKYEWATPSTTLENLSSSLSDSNSSEGK